MFTWTIMMKLKKKSHTVIQNMTVWENSPTNAKKDRWGVVKTPQQNGSGNCAPV